MKTPDSRPRVQSFSRHYHRYRGENPGGWNGWVEGTNAPAETARGTMLRWTLATLAILTTAGAIGLAFFHFL